MKEKNNNNRSKISRRSFLTTSFTTVTGLMVFPGNYLTSLGLQPNVSGSGYSPDQSSLMSDDLEKNFYNVPESAKPWVYWWWLKGNVSRESITRELEEMHKQGVGGVLICDSRGYHDDYYTGNIPVPLHIKHEFMSTGWRNILKHATQEAARLSMQVSVNLSNTGGSLRGPWDMGAHGPKRLIWTAATVKGPVNISAYLDEPEEMEYFWDIALLAVKTESNGSQSQDPSQINLNDRWYEVVNGEEGDAALAYKTVDLSDYKEKGFLNWEVPEGQWRILRFARAVCEEEGHHGGMSAGKGSVDILNEDAVERYFNLMGNTLLDEVGALAGKTLTHFYNVSWEGVYPNWTLGFEKEFKKYRGYDLESYFPVLTGMIVKNIEVSERFMVDYHRTLSDCFRNNCYRKIGELSHARGVKWHSENGGPWRRDAPIFWEADMLKFWGANDMPQAEFWCDSKDRARSNARFAAMAAHTYGRNLVSVEAFTHMDDHWSKYPAYLKYFADMNFIDGANRFIWHTFTSSPSEIGKPGYEYFAGTHFNPNVTWWKESGSFTGYLGRCQYLLTKGYYVADACVYISDKNYARWGRGEKWGNNPTLSLNQGHKYDLVNTDLLVNSLSVDKKGNLLLPDGMKYKLLIVDIQDRAIPFEALQKIYDLVMQGATEILGKNQPQAAPGLGNYPEADNKLRVLTNKLWGEGSIKPRRRSVGRGEIYSGTDIDTVLKNKHILPDFKGPFEYIHRRSEDLDVYFLSGTGGGECIFRVQGYKPEFWDPVTGRIKAAVGYHFTEDGRTKVPVYLPENGSVFIVFRELADQDHVVSVKGPSNGYQVKASDKNMMQLCFWKNGEYQLKFSNKKTREINIAGLSAMVLKGPWEVQFPSGWGAPGKAEFQKLIAWNEHPDDGIRYFSGTATYYKKFRLDGSQPRIPAYLALGEVYNIARVRINDKDLGVIWTDPWTIDVTKALKEGINILEIEVTNTWFNRLVGDAGLTPEKRHTETNVRLVSERSDFQDYEAIAADDPLMPSGLVGPVRIHFGEERRIEI